MFKMFSKKDTNELSFNEREGLIDNYLRYSRDLTESYSMKYLNYKRGGTKELDILINTLTTIRDRISNIETLELIEYKDKWEKLLKTK